MVKIEIYYFAQLREKTNIEKESLELTKSLSVLEIYKLLDEKYQFNFDTGMLRYVLNEEYVGANVIVKEGDDLVFITPVAGG